MAHPGDSSNGSSSSNYYEQIFSSTLPGSLPSSLSSTLSSTLASSLSSTLPGTQDLGEFDFSVAAGNLDPSLQPLGIDPGLQQPVAGFDLFSVSLLDQQQQQQYHIHDEQLQQLGHHQLLEQNEAQQQHLLLHHDGRAEAHLHDGHQHQHHGQQLLHMQQLQLQLQQQQQQQPGLQQEVQHVGQSQYQVQLSQIPQQHQQHQQHQHRRQRSDSETRRKQRQLQRTTASQTQRYLAALQRSSPPSQPQSHPVELVQRATSAFPAPACPPAMSSHPDHSMYPSYKFLTPNFVAENTHQRRLHRSRAAQAGMPLPGAQPLSSTGLSPVSQSMYSPSQSLHSPQTPQFLQAQQSPNPQMHMESVGQSSRKRQGSPPAHSSKRARIAHTPSHLGDGMTPTEFKSIHLRMPSPPNPSTNYFPLLGPATPARRRAASKGKGVASSDQPARSPPMRHDTEMESIISFKLDLLHRSNDKELMAGLSTPIVKEIKAAISSVYVFLPYGHAAPVVKLLNQESFTRVIRDLLATAGAQAGIPGAIEEMPAWQKAYLHKKAPLRQQQPSFSSFQAPFSGASTSQPQPQQGLPDARLLLSCVNMFSDHIMGVYPIIPRPRLRDVVERFLRRYGSESQSQSPASIATQLSLAIDLLVLALGSLCWARLDGTAFEPGPGFFLEAKSILGALTRQSLEKTQNQSLNLGRNPSAPASSSLWNARPDESINININIGLGSSGSTPGPADNAVPGFLGLTPSLDLARAYLLAALFCGQMAWLQEATEYVEAANVVIRSMLFQSAMVGDYGIVSLVEHNHKPHRLSSREQQLVVLYWTCVQLELEINSEVSQTPSGLLRYQSLVPIPESDVFWASGGEAGGALCPDRSSQGTDDSDAAQLDLGNLAPITTQVRLWRQLNTIYEEEYVRKKPANVVKEAVTKMKQQFEASVSSRPLSPTADKNLVTARARSLYCEGRSYGVLNSLQPHLKVDVSEMAEVMLCLIDTIHAYHDLADGGRILPNSFGVAMIQCRYLLVLFAASRTLPAAAAVVGDDLISELVAGTLASLPHTAGPNGVMEAARRVLHAMQTMLQQPQPQPQTQFLPQTSSQAFSEPYPPVLSSPAIGTASSGLHGSAPELSLYCPPFSTRPDILAAVPTATTSSSYISFQTPNTPHGMPNSPFGSPVSPATSCSPSPISATFVPARRLYTGEKLVAFNPNAPCMAGDPGYSSQPSAVSFPAPCPAPCLVPVAPAFDMAAFARHLGLTKPKAGLR